MPSNHHCCPLLLLLSTFPSIRVFSNESGLCIRWPKYWNFSFNISPSNEYSGLITFRMDWLDLLAVQGTLKSLLQHQFKSINSVALSFFLVAQRLKHLPVMWETWVRSLGQEDPLEKKMAIHSSILAWRIPWMEEPGGLRHRAGGGADPAGAAGRCDCVAGACTGGLQDPHYPLCIT